MRSLHSGWYILGLFVWALVLVYGVATYTLHKRPEIVLQYANRFIAEKFPGYTLDIQSLKPTFWPAPGVVVHGAALRGTNVSFLLERGEINLSWSAIFSANLKPTRLALEHATCYAALPINDKKQSNPNEAINTFTTAWALLHELAGLEIDTKEIDILVLLTTPETHRRNEKSMHITGLSGTLLLPHGVASGILGITPGKVDLQATTVRLKGFGNTMLWSDADIQAESIRLLNETTMLRSAKGTFSASFALENVLDDVQVSFEGGLSTLTGQPNAYGNLTADGVVLLGSNKNRTTQTTEEALNPLTLPTTSETLHAVALPKTENTPHSVALSTENTIQRSAALSTKKDIRNADTTSTTAFRLTLQLNSSDIRQYLDIQNTVFTFGDNKAQGAARCVFSPFKAQGEVNVERFSLPRWFAFARALPNDLSAALDVISGTMRFELTKESLLVPDIRFTVRDIPFEGAAVVSDFKQPALRLEAKTKKLDIARLFPTLQETPPASSSPLKEPSVFDHDEESNNTDMDFDIRLWADEATFWNVQGKDFELHIAPVWSRNNNQKQHSQTSFPETKNMVGVRVNTEVKQFYEGELSGILTVLDDLDLSVKLKNGNAAKIMTALGVKPNIHGTLHAQAAVRTPFGDVYDLLGKAKGHLQASLHHGKLSAHDVPLQKMTVDVALQGLLQKKKDGIPRSLPYRFTVKNALHTDTQQTAINVDLMTELAGSFALSTKAWQVLDGKMQAMAEGSLHRIPIAIFVQDATFSVPHKQLILKDVTAQINETHVQGELKGAHLFQTPEWTGQLHIKTSALRALLKQLDMPLSVLPATRLQFVDAQGDIFFSDTEWRLTNLKGRLDEITFTGRAVRNKETTKNIWNVLLTAERLNLDPYFVAQKTKPQKNTQKIHTPWPTELLRDVELDANIHIATLYYKGLEQKNVTVPLVIKNDTLTASPILSTLADGKQEMGLRIIPRKDYTELAFNYTLTDTDMLKLSQMLDVQEGLTGRGNVRLTVAANSRSYADLLETMRGTWQVGMHSGAFVSFQPQNRSIINSRPFRSLSMSGNIENGIMRSNNLRISGNTFAAKGNGIINLKKETVDYTLTASTPGIPVIPIHLSGSLTNPQHNINLLGVVTGLLYHLGDGLFSFLFK